MQEEWLVVTALLVLSATFTLVCLLLRVCSHYFCVQRVIVRQTYPSPQAVSASCVNIISGLPSYNEAVDENDYKATQPPPTYQQTVIDCEDHGDHGLPVYSPDCPPYTGHI